MILDSVGRATVKQLRDSSPLVTKAVVGFDDDSILFRRPVGLPYFGAEVIEPSLSALLANTTLFPTVSVKKIRVRSIQSSVPECETQL